MANSIHLNKWLSLFKGYKNFDFLVFPSTIFKKPNQEYIKFKKSFFIKTESKYKLFIFCNSLINYLFQKIDDMLLKKRLFKIFLKFCIKRYNPDFIHTIEFQSAGYFYLDFLLKNPNQSTWIATNWGSDIFFYQKYPNHLNKIKKILSLADRYSAECPRDYILAKQLNFRGINLPCLPNSGGINFSNLKSIFPKKFSQKEKIILIKAYDSKFSNTHKVITVLKSMHRSLMQYKLVFFSCSDSIISEVNELKNKYKLNIKIIKQSSPIMNYEMMKLFSKSLIYISNSLSDGLSTSMLESMAMGVFPIQSNAACCQHLIKNKINGYIFKSNSLNEIQSALKFSLNNEIILKKAFSYNKKLIFKKANFENIKLKAIKYYS